MKFGLLVRIEAKPEYADQVAAMLRDAAKLARESVHRGAMQKPTELARLIGLLPDPLTDVLEIGGAPCASR